MNYVQVAQSAPDHTSDVLILSLLADAGGWNGWVTAPAIELKATALGELVNRTTIRNRLTRLHVYCRYRTDNKGVRRFRLVTGARDLLAKDSGMGPSPLVRANSPWSSKAELSTFLETHCSQPLFLVDPYISERTLDVVAKVAVQVRILSSHLGERGKEAQFLRELADYRREHVTGLELRQVPEQEMHGRYMFTGNDGWVIDHSVKDLGKKPALILPIQPHSLTSQVRSHFESLFRSGVAM